MSIKFYYCPHSNASRVRMSLSELGVPHETVQLDLKAGDQKRPEFLAINPNGKVPTIVLDGTPMFEAVAIQIALGERFGVEKGLWPRVGSAEHLQALTWLVWSQVSLVTAVMRTSWNESEYSPKEQHNPKQAEVAWAEVQKLLKILDARLDGREYLTGDRYTLADLDVASTIVWADMVKKLELDELPRLRAWVRRCAARPAFKAEMPVQI